ncbi:MAG: hypothetical protein M1376_15910 [Planctomycetes bacterium]|nr:hypothetical protein [Planctomycetota bacterium]
MNAKAIIGGSILALSACLSYAQSPSAPLTRVCQPGLYGCPAHADILATWPARCPLCQTVLSQVPPSTAGTTQVADRDDRRRNDEEARERQRNEELREQARRNEERRERGLSDEEARERARRNEELRERYPYYGYVPPYGYAAPPQGYYYYPEQGYYYNPNLGYYYYPNTGYYYNPNNRQYYYYSPNTEQYYFANPGYVSPNRGYSPYYPY